MLTTPDSLGSKQGMGGRPRSTPGRAPGTPDRSTCEEQGHSSKVCPQRGMTPLNGEQVRVVSFEEWGNEKGSEELGVPRSNQGSPFPVPMSQ